MHGELITSVSAEKPTNNVATIAFSVNNITQVAKIIGYNWGDPADIKITNGPGTAHYHQVGGSDLGAVTLYKNKLYFNLGDTSYDIQDPAIVNDPSYSAFVSSLQYNFLVASAPYATDFFTTIDTQGILLDGYLNLRTHTKYPNGVPTRALENREVESLPDGNTIPNAMFTIKWKGKEYMFAQYMNGADTRGHDHKMAYAALAKYDDALKVFKPYKPQVNIWYANTEGRGLFGMSSFWVDYKAQYVYMVGAPSGRFGGVKLGRIPLSSFLDESDSRDWEYFLGNNTWSNPTKDATIINSSAAWLIPPKDPEWSLTKNYGILPLDEQCRLMTITEFSVVYNPYLSKFLLLMGDASCQTPEGQQVVYYYTSPSINGPWDQTPQKIVMPRQGYDWDYYGVYTTDALLKDRGKTMYFVASTYNHYGVYLYKAEFVK